MCGKSDINFCISQRLSGIWFVSGLFLLVFGKQLRVNVVDDRSFSDGGVAHQLGELIVTSDREVDVLGLDSMRLSELHVGASEFQNFCGNVLEDSSHETTCCNARSLRESGLPHHPVETAHREGNSCSIAPFDLLPLVLGSGHGAEIWVSFLRRHRDFFVF